jgi:hypothetical protein
MRRPNFGGPEFASVPKKLFYGNLFNQRIDTIDMLSGFEIGGLTAGCACWLDI